MREMNGRINIFPTLSVFAGHGGVYLEAEQSGGCSGGLAETPSQAQVKERAEKCGSVSSCLPSMSKALGSQHSTGGGRRISV